MVKLSKRPTVAHNEAAYLTAPQVKALFDSAGESRYRPVFEMLVNTGMRRGEALALKWTDVDEKASLLRIRGTLSRQGGELVVSAVKTEKSKRWAHMTPAVIALLRKVKAEQRAERLRAGSKWHNTGYVFTTETGEPCDPRNALRALQTAAKRAGLTDVGLHTLRHSAASLMIANGTPLKVVSEILGHSSVAITGDVYGHVAPEVSADAMQALSDALG